MTDSEPAQGTSVEPARDGRTDTDPLGHLYKMSPTAGVATTDYAAINSAAIVAIVLGVASVLSLFNSFFLVIPLIGAICGLSAIRQIRNSNGTQVGGLLAWGGLLLSLGIGGSVFGFRALRSIEVRGDQNEISQLMEQIGRDVHDGNYDAVYALCSDRLRARVPADLLATRFKQLDSFPQLGRLTAITWNQEPMIFETNPDTKVETATAMTFEHMEKLSEPDREVMIFVKEGGRWKLNDIPRLFPAQTPQPGMGRGGPSVR